MDNLLCPCCPNANTWETERHHRNLQCARPALLYLAKSRSGETCPKINAVSIRALVMLSMFVQSLIQTCRNKDGKLAQCDCQAEELAAAKSAEQHKTEIGHLSDSLQNLHESIIAAERQRTEARSGSDLQQTPACLKTYLSLFMIRWTSASKIFSA